MATQLDYYGILQVHLRAEKEVIDAAYRRLASKYHPDVSKVSDAADRMKQINAAYEVLSDPDRRAAYDAARGVTPSTGTPPRAGGTSQHSDKARRTLTIVVGLVLLAVVAFRLVPALLLLVTRFVVPLVVISLFVWLLFTLAKPRG
ncbi:MAG: DnaJ domain-containing protein [Dehalococcoidales bacterium]|nr:DnaJ domain-containing protein [Dehalococcoidales bacterium]